MDADLLESLSEKLYCGRPSSYHYTKALAESLVLHNAQNLMKSNKTSTYKSAIIRPSIVTPTLNEPLPGWTNNYYGPTGYLVVCGKGVLRSMIVHKDKICDIVPVDIVANTAITAAYYITKQDQESISTVNQNEQIVNQLKSETTLSTNQLNGHESTNGKFSNGKFQSSEDEEDTSTLTSSSGEDEIQFTNGHLTNGNSLTNGHSLSNGKKLTNGHHMTIEHNNNQKLSNGYVTKKLTNGKLSNGDLQQITDKIEKKKRSTKLSSLRNGSDCNLPAICNHKTMNDKNEFNINQYLTVFNCVSGALNPISWGEIHSLCEPFLLKYPSVELFRYPGALLHSNKLLHQIILQLEHNIPAMLIDFIFKLLGHKPM